MQLIGSCNICSFCGGGDGTDKEKNVMLVQWKEVDESEDKDLRSIPKEWKDASLSRIITARRLLRRVRHRTKLDLIII